MRDDRERRDDAEDILHQVVPWYSGCPTGHSIFDLLTAHNFNAQVYNDSVEKLDSAAWGLTDYSYSSLRDLETFEEDAMAEQMGERRLADVVFIEPNYGHLDLTYGKQDENDEHPPSNIQHGQAFVLRIMKALLSNPTVLAHSVVFITWDENGGFYDHVPPPLACKPDGSVPADFDFARYGFRVPFFAISPWSKPNFASSYSADHTSILRFIEAWKNLPALTARDANAWPLLDMFDFSNPQPIDIDAFPDFQDVQNKVSKLAAMPCPGPGDE